MLLQNILKTDQDNADIQILRNNLDSDFKRNKIRKNVAECLINAAVFGTGIAEIELTTEKEMKPATQPVMGGELTAVGVNIADRTCVKLNPVMPLATHELISPRLTLLPGPQRDVEPQQHLHLQKEESLAGISRPSEDRLYLEEMKPG